MWCSKSLTKILWNYECFHTITQETYKISKIYNEIHEKVYKKLKIFHCVYSSLLRTTSERTPDIILVFVRYLSSPRYYISIFYMKVILFCLQELIKICICISQNYIRADPSPRTEDDVVFMRLSQGKETPAFTACFPNWNPAMWEVGFWFLVEKKKQKKKSFFFF